MFNDPKIIDQEAGGQILLEVGPKPTIHGAPQKANLFTNNTILFTTGVGSVPALTAGSTIQNALSGSTFEYVMRASRIAIGLVTGAVNTIVARILFGSVVIVESAVIPAWAVANRGPIIPDDIIFRGVAMPGNRLVVTLISGDAATQVVRGLVSILPL